MKSFLRPVLAATLTLMVAGPSSIWAGIDLGFQGSFLKWSKVEIDLIGPDSQGLAPTNNPFKIHVEVTFSSPTGGSFTVPAFYDGDGVGGMDGNVWRVRFSPDEIGTWTFASSSADPVPAGLVAEPLLDGYSGSFDVVARTGCTEYQAGGLPDFGCEGRLEWVGEYFLRFREGLYWLKGGVDDPEDFLATGVTAGFPTEEDAITFLADHGINSVYLMTNNVGGDGRNVYPWLDPTPSDPNDPISGSNVDSEHFDLAKLAVWESVFQFIQAKGLVLHIVLEDDRGWTGFNRFLYYREMVARFGHHNGLIWNLAEEYNENYQDPDDIKEFAGTLRSLDSYSHPLTVHHEGSKRNWEPFLGHALFDLTSLHTSANPMNDVIIAWRENSQKSGRIIPISVDEAGDKTPLESDGVTPDAELVRHIVWSVYTGGGMLEVRTYPLGSYTDYESILADVKRARAIVEKLPFWEMDPANELVDAGDAYLLSKAGEAYLAYLPTGGTVSLNLASNNRLFDVRWSNPRNDSPPLNENRVTGGGVISFTAPDDNDWVLILESVAGSGNVAPVASNQTLMTAPDTILTFNLSFVDTDGPGPNTFSVVRPPIAGSVSSIDTTGLVSFTPAAFFVGDDSFDWSVNDSLADSNVATVTIRVNTLPTAHDQNVSMLEDSSVALTLTGGDVDLDPLTFSIDTSPTYGELAGIPPNVMYSANPDYWGSDSFEFRVDDGRGGSDRGTVYLTIDPVNDPPMALDQAVSALPGVALGITLSASDVDGDILVFSVLTQPAHGGLSGVAPDLVYLPDIDYLGQDEFSFQVDDGQVADGPGTVSILVTESGIFMDSFESGDLAAWSTCVP